MDDDNDRSFSKADFEGPYIGEEERIRHDALFYSQNPDDGLLLSGERARSLFIKSKLPLQELSKIWKLADVTRDNMLDESEFAVAVHLIQRRLCGFDIPETIPVTWRPESRPLLVINQANEEELKAYDAVFNWLQTEDNAYLNNETVLKFLGTSNLPTDVLAKVWDLSDIDRDGRINKDEFFIALHITRFCVNNKSNLSDSVDVLSILPKKVPGESIQDKRRKRTEYQTEMRKLTSLKDKLQIELINAERNENMAAKAKIQFELDKTSRELEAIVKKESDLRQEITQMNLQTSVTTDIEVMRPFDRSFLMKRQSCGADFLKQIKYQPGQCSFCEDVTADIFDGENILNFVRNLPVNPSSITKRRGSKSPQKDNSEEREEEIIGKQSSSIDSHSSDDESDSVDIGIRRKRRNRPKSERDKIANKDPGNQRRIRSLSEAINEIAARNKAAKQEMDFRMIRSQSGTEKSTEGSSGDSSVDEKITKKKEAFKKRSKSAVELFQKLFSSDSESASDRESPTKRMSVKSLQKSPWNERKEILKQSSSENETTENFRKTSGRKQELLKSGSNSKDAANLAENDSPISVVEKKETAYDLQRNFELLESQTNVYGKTEESKMIPGPKRISKSRETVSSETERPENYQNGHDQFSKFKRKYENGKVSKEGTVGKKDEVINIGSLLLKPIEVNGSYEMETTSDTRQEFKKVKESDNWRRGSAVEEEAVAPSVVSVDEKVRGLIDLLDETSCDSIEEETFRRKISESDARKEVSVSEVTNRITTSDNEFISNRAPSHNQKQLRNCNTLGAMPVSSNESSFHSRSEGSASDDVGTTSGADTSDGGLHESEANAAGAVEAGSKENVASPSKKKKKVLRTKSGQVVRSKSLYGLRSHTDPNRLSYVDECEWLDTLVQVELETIEKRKKVEEEASQSPKVEGKEKPQFFSRSETIDEESLNLHDSRKLVKTLLDMEMEGRKEKEETVQLRENKKRGDKEALERRKSMPVGKEALHAAEAGLFIENESRSEVDSTVSVKSGEISKGSNIDVVNHHKIIDHKNDDKDLVKCNESTVIKPEKNDSKLRSLSLEDSSKKFETKHQKPHGVISPGVHQPTLSEDTQSKQLHRQTSFEDNKPLKNVRAFKEIFEDKSIPGRPVDSYHKSLSMDVKPVGLTRSKSLGGGLNRPSEESKHIKVFEKQPSIEKKDQMHSSDASRSRDVVFYEEAKEEITRKKSLEDIKHLKTKQDVKSEVGEMESTKQVDADEENVPHFKNIGEFKQLFETGVRSDGKISKIHVAVARKEDLEENAHVETSESLKDISSIKSGVEKGVAKEKLVKGKENTEIQKTDLSSVDMPNSQTSHTQAEKGSAEEEDSIPSIKDKLALFQKSFDQGVVKRKETRIRKIRPKSFHGRTLLEASDSDESIAKEILQAEEENAGVNSRISRNTMNIRDIGEWVLQGTTNGKVKQEQVSEKHGGNKGVIESSSLDKATSSKNVSQKASLGKTPLISPKTERPENNEMTEGDKNWEAFSYTKVVKDERIRKELEEQEAREREIRARLKSTSLEKTDFVENQGENEPDVSSNKNNRSGSFEKPKEKNGLTDGKLTNGSLDYLSYVKNDRVRKEIEEQERREMEVKQRIAAKEKQAKEKASNPVKHQQGHERIPADESKLHESKIRKDVGTQRSSFKKIQKGDSNGNFASNDIKEHEEKSGATKESLKSRKMPSRIEIELEEERRREKELEEERKKREAERNQVLQEEKRKIELMEAENKRVEKEELAKQNAALEEKMKRQERTRGLRAMFETS